MREKHQSLWELAVTAEQYMSAHSKKLQSRDFSSTKTACAPGSGKKCSVASAMQRASNCFGRGKLEYKASESFPRVQDRNARRDFCNRCGAEVFMEWIRVGSESEFLFVNSYKIWTPYF